MNDLKCSFEVCNSCAVEVTKVKDKQECISSVGFDLIERITRGRHEFYCLQEVFKWRLDGGKVLYVPVEMVVEFCMFLWRW